MRHLEVYAIVTGLFGCASPSLDGVRFSCEVDADCPAQQVCLEVEGARPGECTVPNTKAITLGFSGPLEGRTSAFGRQVKRGIEACLQEVNDRGGVLGRRLDLRALNDDGDPRHARENGLELLNVQRESGADKPDRVGKGGVFAMVGSAGLGAALELAPLFTKNRRVLFAPTTGVSKYLRDGTNSTFVFNVRAGYRAEASAMIDYLARHRVPRVTSAPYSHRRILAVTQDDLVGKEGYEGLVEAFDRSVAPLPSTDAIPHFVHAPDDVAPIDGIVERMQAYMDDLLMAVSDSTVPVAVVLATDYEVADSLIRKVKGWSHESLERAQRLDLQFVAYSFVDADALQASLERSPAFYTDVRDGETQHAYVDGVMVMQTVPHYASASRGASQYRGALAALDGEPPSFGSLEGYLSARLFVEAVERTGRSLSTESLIDTLKTNMAEVDLDWGTQYSFSGDGREASDSIWAIVLRKGRQPEPSFVWRRSEGIVLGAW